MGPAGALPPRLDDADWLQRSQTQAVFRALQAGGYSARAVGGAVRNALLGLPVTDVDIATPAPPEEVIRLAEAANLKAIGTGLKHGTVTIVAGRFSYEVTTLREDVETFGRHAKVAFTADWAADARRRDFTMNALYCDADGVVHDPLDGYGDVLARRIRFIGDARARIREDYLRILRFFRMSAVYSTGPLDADGLQAALHERAGLRQLSSERVRQELMRLLAAPRAPEVLDVMRDYGFLTTVLPVAPRISIVRRLADIEAAEALRPDPVLRLAALGVEVIEDAVRLRDRLRLSTAEFELLAAAAEAPRALRPGVDEHQAKVWLYRLGPDRMRKLVLLNWARSPANPHDAAGHDLFMLAARWTPPRFPLGGADVLAAGVPAGPRVGEVLREIEDWWIAAGFPSDRAVIVEELARRLGS